MSPRHLFVVNTGDGTVSFVDLDAMKETKRHEVGPRPYGIAVSRDGKTVAVGVEDEEKVKFYSLELWGGADMDFFANLHSRAWANNAQAWDWSSGLCFDADDEFDLAPPLGWVNRIRP